MPCFGSHFENFEDAELFSNILRGSKVVGFTIESYGKVEISYINIDNF
jgi:hypothetical protein